MLQQSSWEETMAQNIVQAKFFHAGPGFVFAPNDLLADRNSVLANMSLL
jgi:hypothetical protein